LLVAFGDTCSTASNASVNFAALRTVVFPTPTIEAIAFAVASLPENAPKFGAFFFILRRSMWRFLHGFIEPSDDQIPDDCPPRNACLSSNSLRCGIATSQKCKICISVLLERFQVQNLVLLPCLIKPRSDYFPLLWHRDHERAKIFHPFRFGRVYVAISSLLRKASYLSSCIVRVFERVTKQHFRNSVPQRFPFTLPHRNGLGFSGL